MNDGQQKEEDGSQGRVSDSLLRWRKRQRPVRGTGYLLPTEPDQDEREKIRRELKAASDPRTGAPEIGSDDDHPEERGALRHGLEEER
jgi:hypothetical protein